MRVKGTYYVQNYGNVCEYVQAITVPESVENTVPAGTYLRERIDIHKTKKRNGVISYKLHCCTPMGVDLCRTIEFNMNEPFKDFTLDGRPCESIVHRLWKDTLFYVQEVKGTNQILSTLLEGYNEGKNFTITMMSSEPSDVAAVQHYIRRPDVNMSFCPCDNNHE